MVEQDAAGVSRSTTGTPGQGPSRAIRFLAAAGLLAIPLAVLLVIIARSMSSNTAGTATPQPALTEVAWNAATAHWQATALKQEIDSLLRLPDALVAGTAAGIWRSNDAGVTWKQDRTGLVSQVVTSLAAGAGSTLFAGAGDGKVYSKSGTASWQAISPEFGSSAVFSLAASPDSGAVLAGVNTGIFRGVLLKGHWQWTQVLHTDLSSVASITYTPWKPRVIYAAIFGQTPPVVRSTDDGRTWRAWTTGLPASLPTEQLLITAAGGRQVILTTMGSGVWRTDGSNEWSDISKGLPERHAMPIAVTGSGVFFAGTMEQGVYVKQQGALWTRAGAAMVGPAYVALAMTAVPGAHPVIIVGTSAGLFRLPVPSGL